VAAAPSTPTPASPPVVTSPPSPVTPPAAAPIASGGPAAHRGAGAGGGVAGGAKHKKARDAVEASLGGEAAEGGARAGGEGGGDCSITIGSRPWAEVWIDGKNTSKHTPFADYKIACGKHKIQFRRADLQIDRTEAITVKPGEKFKQSYALVNDE
jgi:hypothetical protein